MNQNLSREIIYEILYVLAYKKQTNMCVSLRRKSLKRHLKSIMEKEINTNKRIFISNFLSFLFFLNSLSFFLQTITNKGFIRSNDITLVENKVVTTDEKTLASTFNKHCINIVEITSEKIPKKFQKYHMAKANRKYSVIF